MVHIKKIIERVTLVKTARLHLRTVLSSLGARERRGKGEKSKGREEEEKKKEEEKERRVR